jgi:hypothetical protein
MMHFPYFSILDWLAVGFFLILFIALSLLSAQAKKTSIILGGIFASFLVSTFGGVLSVVILEKYTKSAYLSKVKERRILFNETMFINGFIVNNGRFSLNYCKLDVKLINGDRNKYSKGTFFKSSGFNIFGGKNKKQTKPQVIKKTKYFTFKPPLKPGYFEPFSVNIKYPGYFKNAIIKEKLYCH